MEKAGTDRSREAAQAIMSRVFGAVDPGIRYRLWDGSETEVGRPDGSFTLVVSDRETFRRCFSSRNSQIFAEAFIEAGLDCDGDLFAGLRVANQLEYIPLTWSDRLAIWRDLRRI